MSQAKITQKRDISTRERVIDEAAKLFYLNGYKETTMRSLASAVGIRHPSLFSLFENKSAIAAHLLSRYFRGIQFYTQQIQDEIDERHSRTENLLIFYALNCLMISKDDRFTYFYSSFYSEDPERVISTSLHLLYKDAEDRSDTSEKSIDDMIRKLDYQLFSYIAAMLIKQQLEHSITAKDAAIYFAAKKIDCCDPLWNLTLENVIEFYDKHWDKIENVHIDVYKDLLNQPRFDNEL